MPAWIDRLKEELAYFEIDHLVLKKRDPPGIPRFCRGGQDHPLGVHPPQQERDGCYRRRFLEELLDEAGIIQSLQTDNGGEFKGAFTDWLKARGIKQKTIKPGSPAWNNQVENINNILRMRCFNFHRDDEKDFNGLRLLIR